MVLNIIQGLFCAVTFTAIAWAAYIYHPLREKEKAQKSRRPPAPSIILAEMIALDLIKNFEKLVPAIGRDSDDFNCRMTYILDQRLEIDCFYYSHIRVAKKVSGYLFSDAELKEIISPALSKALDLKKEKEAQEQEAARQYKALNAIRLLTGLPPHEEECRGNGCSACIG